MGRYDEAQLRQLEPQVLRALLREAVHHGVETRLYPALQGERQPFAIPQRVRTLMRVYEERQLSGEKEDYQWAKTVIALAEKLESGQPVDFPGHSPQPYATQARQTVETVIFKRRSIRQWTDQTVPREMIRRIVAAGTYAATACNVQGTRYLVVEDADDLAAIPAREFSGETAKIITLLDMRPYEILSHIPRRNLLLDVGAAMQNMLIAAESLGLGAVWGTFNDQEMERVRERFQLEAYLDIISYISLGYAAEKVLPPGRISPEDAVVNWESMD